MNLGIIGYTGLQAMASQIIGTPRKHEIKDLESTEIGEPAAHATKLVPSVRDRSSRWRMNFTRIEVLAAVARNSGRVLRRATATTFSEGASPGRTVRIHEPKDRQTSLGWVAERICSSPWAMSPSWMWRW